MTNSIVMAHVSCSQNRLTFLYVEFVFINSMNSILNHIQLQNSRLRTGSREQLCAGVAAQRGAVRRGQSALELYALRRGELHQERPVLEEGPFQRQPRVRVQRLCVRQRRGDHCEYGKPGGGGGFLRVNILFNKYSFDLLFKFSSI